MLDSQPLALVPYPKKNSYFCASTILEYSYVINNYQT